MSGELPVSCFLLNQLKTVRSTCLPFPLLTRLAYPPATMEADRRALKTFLWGKPFLCPHSWKEGIPGGLDVFTSICRQFLARWTAGRGTRVLSHVTLAHKSSLANGLDPWKPKTLRHLGAFSDPAGGLLTELAIHAAWTISFRKKKNIRECSKGNPKTNKKMGGVKVASGRTSQTPSSELPQTDPQASCPSSNFFCHPDPRSCLY